MARSVRKPFELSKAEARALWLRAQRLDAAEPFGPGPGATKTAIEHLGYVQIDTINVIERCHHHILWSRIPAYRRAHLHRAQTVDKSVFEYWTHALSFIPVRDLKFFLPAMKRHRTEPSNWQAQVTPAEIRKVLRRISEQGALTIRDIDDDVLVEKDHPWASKKPSKRALQRAFYDGRITISERIGMVKTYEMIDRHFGWETAPKAATEAQQFDYLLDRALTAQGVVSLDSICHLAASKKPAIRALIDKRVRKKQLVPVAIEDAGKQEHWAAPEALESAERGEEGLVHILSPFDPLIIQRKRLKLFFGYDHLFEAYVPADKRVFGYFGLPVLVGDEVVAVLDIKTDRQKHKLDIKKWSWLGPKRHKPEIEKALARFERFQLASKEVE
jgi:uncharacterized protein YcaQ